jgi:hypothetical protein
MLSLDLPLFPPPQDHISRYREQSALAIMKGVYGGCYLPHFLMVKNIDFILVLMPFLRKRRGERYSILEHMDAAIITGRQFPEPVDDI